MSDKLRKSIQENCVKILRTMLVTQQELINDRKKKGIKVYSLDEYNKQMKLLFPNGFWMSDKKSLIVQKIEKDLSSNLILTDEEIEELLSIFEKKILEYDFNCLKDGSYSITYLVDTLINENDDNKWSMSLNSSYPLGINPSLMMYCVYRTDLFIIQNINRKYFCYLDKEGNDRIEEFSIFRRTNDKFPLKNLYVVLTNEGFEDFVYKDGNLYQSVRVDSSYKDELFKNKISVSSILDKIGVRFDEVLDLLEIADIERLIYNYLETSNEIEPIVDSAVEKLEMLIFDETNVAIYRDCMDLIPSYTGKQKGRLKKELSIMIKTELLKNGEFEFDLAPKYNNKLVELLDKLLIIPSPLILGKTMKIDLETMQVVLSDNKNNIEEVIYSTKSNTSSKSKKRILS